MGLLPCVPALELPELDQGDVAQCQPQLILNKQELVLIGSCLTVLSALAPPCPGGIWKVFLPFLEAGLCSYCRNIPIVSLEAGILALTVSDGLMARAYNDCTWHRMQRILRKRLHLCWILDRRLGLAATFENSCFCAPAESFDMAHSSYIGADFEEFCLSYVDGGPAWGRDDDWYVLSFIAKLDNGSKFSLNLEDPV